MKVIKLSYRRMEIDDIDTVMQVETKVYTYPWTERIFKDLYFQNQFLVIVTFKKSIK